MIIARRTNMTDQHASDAAQMRTPPPLTPADIQRRVLRLCQEYDRIEDAKKKNVRNKFSYSIKNNKNEQKKILLI